MTRGEFYEAVCTYCFLLGGSITSGFRTRDHNASNSGKPYSPHQVGLGADVVYDGDVYKPARKEWATRLGLLLVHEDDHDHLQPAGWIPG